MTPDEQAQLITPDIFNHLVKLAALELSDQEAEYLRTELNHQLNAVHELESIPLAEDTPPASHGVPYTVQISQPIRQDAWSRYAQPEKILAQAPETEDGYIIVPDIQHMELK